MVWYWDCYELIAIRVTSVQFFIRSWVFYFRFWIMDVTLSGFFWVCCYWISLQYVELILSFLLRFLLLIPNCCCVYILGYSGGGEGECNSVKLIILCGLQYFIPYFNHYLICGQLCWYFLYFNFNSKQLAKLAGKIVLYFTDFPFM